MSQVGQERPRLVEVLDDVAADDPVEFLPDEGHDLARVAAVDVVDPLPGHSRRAWIDLDADHAALLPCFQGSAQGRFAAAELEDRLRVGRDPRQKVGSGLSAQRAPAVDVVGGGEDHFPAGQGMFRRVVDSLEERSAAEIDAGIGR